MAKRALHIGLLVASHAARFGLGWLWRLLSRSGASARQAWLGLCLLNLFRALGATFIKIGQIMSTRPDLLPEHITSALSRLLDAVGPFSFAQVRETIRADLGSPPERLFDEFSPAPLASGSVAQVHRARLHDGRTVAVKVRRPGVVDICRFDLAVMRAAADLLAYLPRFKAINVRTAVEQFGHALSQQLDFRIEARNNLRFRNNFRAHPSIQFPQLEEELCTQRVIVMSYVEGLKILDVRGSSHDPGKVARIGLRALLKMIFEDGFVHADLHPGNMFVSPTGALVLIDLGLVGELTPEQMKTFRSFFLAWAQRDGDEMAHLMYRLSDSHHCALSESEDAYERYRAAIIEFVGRYWGKRLGDVHVGRVLMDLLGILREHNVRMSAVFTTINIAIAVTEGIGKQLDPELDLMQEALPFFMGQAG